MPPARNPMVHTLPLSRARATLSSLVKRVHRNKEHFVVEVAGIPVAALMDIDEFEDYLELQNADLQKQIAAGYEEYVAGQTRDADAVLAEIRRELVEEPPKRQRRPAKPKASAHRPT